MVNTTYVIDSFTDIPFSGNPAGVYFYESLGGALGCEAGKDALSDGLMLNIAKELGLSETAFIWRTAEAAYFIRYFSPKMEIDLCGHATLAAAQAVFHDNERLDHVEFETGAGLKLSARRNGDEILMRFPAYEMTPAKISAKVLGALLSALGIKDYTELSYHQEMKTLVIEINSAKVLANLAPDFGALLKSHDGLYGVSVTARSQHDNFDFESRYFWPWSGTDEDPVTGAIHCALAPYWSKRLGKTLMRARQCSARGGVMGLELIGGELIIRAQAKIIFKGELFI